MKAVYLEWIDHGTYSKSNWRSMQELKDLTGLIIKEVGFIAHEDKDFLTLVGRYDEVNECYGGEIKIYKKCIAKRKNVRI